MLIKMSRCPPARGPGVGNRRTSFGSWKQVLAFLATDRHFYVSGLGIPAWSPFATRESGLAGLRRRSGWH